MLPPKYPRSPRSVINYQRPSSRQNYDQVPYPNQKIRNSNSKQRDAHRTINSVDTRSKVSKYQNLRTSQQKRKALGKKRYINQLAYLDYQDKYIQVHTKYTMVSKISAMKKIKAKNQMAQFIEQQQEQELGFEQLMDYKYGRQANNQNYHFQKEQLINEYQFCPKCDSIHNDHSQVHEKICNQKIFSNQEYDKTNLNYVYLCLERILNCLKRTSGQQYDSLKQLIQNLVRLQTNTTANVSLSKGKSQHQQSNLQKCLKYLNELLEVNQNDKIIKQIVLKILIKLYKRKKI